MLIRPHLLAFCFPLLGGSVVAQDKVRGEELFVEGGRLLRVWNGEGPGEQFGWVARVLKDANGDGVADVLTCAPFRQDEGVACGRIYLYSGKDGSLIRQHDGAAGDLLGLSVSAAGDLDRDGCSDYAASATQPRTGTGKVVIWSGRTGEVLRTLLDPAAKAEDRGWNFGRELASVGDWDQDGWPDMAVTAPQAPSPAGAQAGKLQIRSGKDGSVLAEVLGKQAGGQFGTCIAASAKPQGLGEPLLVVGAMGEGPRQQGRVHVFHGRAPRLAFVLEPEAYNVNFGRFFASIPGDCDGDGKTELYVVDFEGGKAGPGSGEVRVVSGETGREVHRLHGAVGEGLGIGNAAAGDCDGDGCVDLIVGAWQHASAAPSGGKATLYSGKTGKALRTWTCKLAQETFGFDAVGIGDLDGDGLQDFLLTGAYSGVAGAQSGRVYVVAGDTPRSLPRRD
jgi:FG-GAP repeat